MKSDQDSTLQVFGDADELVEPTSSFVVSVQKLNRTLTMLETLHGVIHVPSYHNIRHAFEHMAEAISLAETKDSESASQRISLVEQSLGHARANAVRATVEYCHYRLLLVEQRFSSEVIYRHCPEYYDLVADLEKANELAGREAESLLESQEDYEWLESVYTPKLVKVYERISRAEEVALVPEQAQLKTEKFYRRLAICGFIVGVLGLVAALTAFLI